MLKKILIIVLFVFSVWGVGSSALGARSFVYDAGEVSSDRDAGEGRSDYAEESRDAGEGRSGRAEESRDAGESSSIHYQTITYTAERNFPNTSYTPHRMLNKKFLFISHDDKWNGGFSYGRLFDTENGKEYEESTHYIHISYRSLTSDAKKYYLDDLHPDIVECIKESDFYKNHMQSYYYVLGYTYYYNCSPYLDKFSDIETTFMRMKNTTVVENDEILHYGSSDEYVSLLVHCYDEIEEDME